MPGPVTRFQRALRPHAAAIVVFSALAVVHTWPLATNPAAWSLNDADTMLNEWILAWVVHQLPRDPMNLFDGNMFHPARDTLAFSEPLILPAILAAPLFWSGASPVLAYNLLLLAGFIATALASYAVAFSWTRDGSAALVAGSLFAFNTHTLTRLPHLQAIHAYGLPLALLFTDRLITRPRPAAALGLAAAMAAMAYTSGYLLIFATLAIGVTLLCRAREWWRRPRPVIAAFALSAAAAAVVVAPMATAYRRVAVEQGMVRSLENVRQFSASPRGYLAATGRIHAAWSARFLRNPVDTFFPGFLALSLAALAIRRAVPAGAQSSHVLMLCCIGVTGFVLSLGTRTPLYGWLFSVFPPMQGLRAAARFGNLFLLAVALLAAIGFAALRQASAGRRVRAMTAVAVVLVVNLEVFRAPFEYKRFDGIPAIYRMIAMAPDPVVLVETPFYPAHAAFRNAEYMLNSTAHWRRLMNGYSGYTPASYRKIAWTFWNFPRPDAIQAMRDAGVTHVTVHPDRYNDGRAEDVFRQLAERPDVELLGISEGGGPRLYRFR